MTSLETLLAAANFVEANDRPDNLARGSLCYFTMFNSCSSSVSCSCDSNIQSCYM